MADIQDIEKEAAAREAAALIAEKMQEYQALIHALQSGVKYTMERNEMEGVEGDTSPKHLRVGVNSMMVSQAAVVRLLQEHGVFTGVEYVEALILETRREIERYEQELSQRMGTTVTLG